MPAPSDLVHQTTTTTGTGAKTLTAVNGKRSFLTAFGTGGTNTFDYYVSNRDAAEWERGTGHEDAGTLVSDTVLASSNAGAAVNFSAGTKDVTNDIPAGNQARLDAANIWTADQTILSADAGAAAAPTLNLDRSSASPAASDKLGAVDFLGRDDGGNSAIYARINGLILDPANGSEDGTLEFWMMAGGTLTLVAALSNLGRLTMSSVGSDGLRVSGTPGSAGMVHIRPSSGSNGYITYTENGVADRWAHGVDTADGTFYFRENNATGTKKFRVAATGFGYPTGTGGAVTQATSKSTGVTLSTLSGQITLNNAALAADTTVNFTLTNTNIAATDNVQLWHQSAGTAGSYLLNAQAAAGSASINVRNITAGSLSEAIVIGFNVIKGATS